MIKPLSFFGKIALAAVGWGTNHGGICLTVAECAGWGAACQGRTESVNLEWRPSTVTVPINGITEIGLYAGPVAQIRVSHPCNPPTVAATGPRYISITPPAGTDPIAFQVKGNPANSQISCITRYVQAPTRICVGGAVQPGTACTSNANCAGGACVTTAVLGTQAVYLAPSAWNGPIQLRSELIGPNLLYEVRSDCNLTAPGSVISSMVSATTWRWGDTNNSGPPVNFLDIEKTIEGFRGRFSSTLTMESVDLNGVISCLPNRQCNFIDVSGCVDAFQGNAFAFCTPPCP